jgi:hypothetical protein
MTKRVANKVSDNTYPVGGGMQQALKYGQTLDIPFIFSSNGDAFLFHDRSVWRKWREKSVAALRRQVQYAVLTDITGYYDNIPLDKLSSELRRIGASEKILSLLRACLYRWSQPRNEGIPQGYPASDVLAKLYLTSVDRRLMNTGFTHLHYVDDIRIFCSSRLEAKRVIKQLSSFAFERGLTLQTAKTEIKTKTEARSIFDGVNEIINVLNTDLAEELQAVDNSGYFNSAELIRLLEDREGPPPAILERAFLEYFGAGSTEVFNHTLFHYLLVRLGRVRSRVAVQYCIECLAGRPEETNAILKYFQPIGLHDDEQEAVVAYMGSDEAIYDYQLYQLLKWFYEQGINDADVLRLARAWSRDRNRDPWLRSYSFSYLGAFGDNSDHDELEGEYQNSESEIERCDRIAGLTQAERGRRNSFYARVENDGPLVSRAVRIARST